MILKPRNHHLYLVSQIFDIYSPSFLSALCVLHQLTGIAEPPSAGDQVVIVVYHVAVGPDNSQGLGYSLHARR